MQDELAKELIGTVNTVEKLRELEKKMHKSIKQEELEVERAVEAIKIKAQVLIDRIREISQPKLTQIDQQLAHLREKIMNIEAKQCMLQIMPDGEFISQTDTLTHQIAKLHIEDKEAVQIHGDHSICKFVANAQLGKIIQSRKLELIEEFGYFERATGIATISTGSIVVSDRTSRQVSVFENKSGQYKKYIEIDVKHAVETCFDVATSHDDKILVANATAGIGIYSSDEGKRQGQIANKSDTKIQERTVCVTTTADGRILTGSVGKVTGYNMTVYDAAGNILKTIPTSVLPFRIVDVCGTMVSVCNVLKNKVCVYDLQSGKETINLDIDMPLGIIYDEQSDCLLIGRMTEKDKFGKGVPRNGVIEQYCCNTGTLVARIAQGLWAPRSMTFTRDGMLVVTSGKTVKLYHMS